MIALIPLVVILLLAGVVIFQPLATWAIVCLVVAGILVFLISEQGHVTRFRNRQGPV